ncbi:MAG: hypothetical protein U0640_02315 [Phycisphaerales bacterium]
MPESSLVGDHKSMNAELASISIAGPTIQVVRRWWAFWNAGNASAETDPING